MGSGYYHADVATARRDIGSERTSSNAFDYSRRASAIPLVGVVHPDLNIYGKRRECRDSAQHPESTPIVVAMDVTSSRGKDAKVIYGQVPSMMGSLKLMGLVPNPEIMWCAIGDANSDRAPIQVSQFEADRRIDEQLAKIWMEEGGGGSGEESYELTAWYLAHKLDLDITKRRKKGFVFFTADEAPYPKLSRSFAEAYLGESLSADVPTEDIFKTLAAKFHTFLVYPRSNMEDRKTSIDTEIRRRLTLAGGRFQEVDIRASLIWNDRNDLDLHCQTPAGHHIYYHAKRAPCGGELDVDQNVRGDNPKPVENIRWAKGDARQGIYKFSVENYNFHENPRTAVPFKVELEINGQIQTIEGRIPAGATHGASRQAVAEFCYVPEANRTPSDLHKAYGDDVVLEKWGRYLPQDRILRVQDPASSVEVMLGAIALQQGLSLEAFEQAMRDRNVTTERRADVRAALTSFAAQGVFTQVPGNLFD